MVGLRTYAGVLAGESISYADEAEGCYGVRPAHTDEAVFAAAHEQLEELLPGDGPLAERYERWESSIRVPTEQIESLLAAAINEARAWTRDLIELPEGEGVVLEIVRDKPWWASCDYLGDLRSRIAINVDLPMSSIEVLVLASHETYPGHHTERSCKEHLLVRGRGLLEETLVLSPTPQSLVTEGIAVLAPYMLLEGDGGAALAAVVHDAGVDLDLAHALAVRRALDPCRWAEVNAALMLHDEGASEAEAHAYLERWGLMTPQWASPHDPLHDGTDPADLRDHLPRRTRALRRVCGRRSGTVPSPRDRTGASSRPARGLPKRLERLCKTLRSWDDGSALDHVRRSTTDLGARVWRRRGGGSSSTDTEEEMECVASLAICSAFGGS